MPSFLYFVEAQRAAIGTGDAPFMELLRCPVSRRVENGPNGAGGVLIYEEATPIARAQVAPAAQLWKLREIIPGLGNVWVGMWRDWIPTEEDLRRAKPTVGELGNEWVAIPGSGSWLLPVLTHATGNSRLPRAAELADDGSIVWAPVLALADWEERGRRLWETAVATMELRAPAGPVLSSSEILALVHQALAVHYRVGRAEINMLQIFPGESFLAAAFAMVGLDTFKAALRLVESAPGKPAPLLRG